jgi:hypothetical protein
MPDDLAAANVNRAYSLAATSITVFTFTMVFLYPKYVSGDVNAPLFQATLVVMAVATFSFVLTTFHYYGSSLSGRVDDDARRRFAQRGDALWLLGYSLLFLEPSLVLFTVGLTVPGVAWLILWLVYGAFILRYFPLVRSR